MNQSVPSLWGKIDEFRDTPMQFPSLYGKLSLRIFRVIKFGRVGL